MPIYIYKGYDLNTGADRRGKVDAENLKLAKYKLKQKDKIIAIEIKEELNVKKKSTNQFLFLLGRVSSYDIAVMTRQFATLISAQVPVDEALRALTKQVDNIVLRNTLLAVKDTVSEGKSLAEAMSAYPKIFSSLYVNMVRAGENSGTLEIILQRLANFLEYQNEMKGKILSAMTYPIIMMSVSLGIIILLFVRVVPKLMKVFNNLNISLPWYTKLSLNISYIIQNYWYILLGTFVVGFLWFRYWYSTETGKKKVDSILLKIPVFGGIILRLSVSRFTRTLSTLLSSGVPILKALDIVRNVVGNYKLSEAIELARNSVQEGQSLALVIERSEIFPPLVTHMIATGERTGRLEEMLSHVASAYDVEVERKVSTLIALLEPIMTLTMTAIVVLVLFSLLMPMLSIMSHLR